MDSRRHCPLVFFDGTDIPPDLCHRFTGLVPHADYTTSSRLESIAGGARLPAKAGRRTVRPATRMCGHSFCVSPGGVAKKPHNGVRFGCRAVLRYESTPAQLAPPYQPRAGRGVGHARRSPAVVTSQSPDGPLFLPSIPPHSPTPTPGYRRSGRRARGFHQRKGSGRVLTRHKRNPLPQRVLHRVRDSGSPSHQPTNDLIQHHGKQGRERDRQKPGQHHVADYIPPCLRHAIGRTCTNDGRADHPCGGHRPAEQTHTQLHRKIGYGSAPG